MNKTKVISYLIVLILPMLFAINIYIDRFSDSMKVAQKNVYAIYSEVGFPEGVTYLEEFNMNKRWRSYLYVGGRYNKSILSENTIKTFYHDKLISLGWSKMEENIYRRNRKEWIRVEVYDDNILSLRTITYILDYDSDRGYKDLQDIK